MFRKIKEKKKHKSELVYFDLLIGSLGWNIEKDIFNVITIENGLFIYKENESKLKTNLTDMFNQTIDKLGWNETTKIKAPHYKNYNNTTGLFFEKSI